MSSVLPSLSESVGLRQERMERPRTGLRWSSVWELEVDWRAESGGLTNKATPPQMIVKARTKRKRPTRKAILGRLPAI
jgi:hypothetical protein